MTRRDIADLVVQMAGENPQWGSGACPNLDPTSLRGSRGSRLVLCNRAPALTAAAHDNETAALSLFEQPFCSGVQGAKVTLLRVPGLSTDRQVSRSNPWRTTNRSNRGSGGGEVQ